MPRIHSNTAIRCFASSTRTTIKASIGSKPPCSGGPRATALLLCILRLCRTALDQPGTCIPAIATNHDANECSNCWADIMRSSWVGTSTNTTSSLGPRNGPEEVDSYSLRSAALSASRAPRLRRICSPAWTSTTAIRSRLSRTSPPPRKKAVARFMRQKPTSLRNLNMPTCPATPL